MTIYELTKTRDRKKDRKNVPMNRKGLGKQFKVERKWKWY